MTPSFNFLYAGLTIIVIFGLLWLAVLYNRVVRDRQLVREAWSGIDVQLKRRHDLIPNIVETVKGYSGHERELFTRVAELRSAGAHPQERAEEENALTSGLRSLIALAEAYPELKADQHYLSLQRTLAEVEEDIQYARRYYNGAVRQYNILIESFPNNLVAGVAGWHSEPYFEIELATQRETPNVSFTP